MKKKLTILLILFLIISEIITLSLIFKKEDNTILKDIEITNNFNNKKQMISIKVENDDDYEYHDYEDKTKWPDKTKYTYAGSLCTDWGGNTIADNIIKFNEVTYEVTITTKKTAYCTLYFTKGKPAKKVLEDKGGSKFNSANAVFGLYRFKGTQSDVSSHYLNNFICFGTTDLATCTGNKQTYMYRIIGITDNSAANTTVELEANQLKIIRAFPFGNGHVWHTNSRQNVTWDNVDIQIYLNDSFISTEKAKWINGDFWEGIIDEPYWYIGDNSKYQNATSESVKSTDIHKVGLIYISDYVNAGTTDVTNWLFIGNGMSGSSLIQEWTMSRYYGLNEANEVGAVYSINTSGKFSWGLDPGAGIGTKNAVRPVFYLKSNVTLAGEGTEASPFIITSKN